MIFFNVWGFLNQDSTNKMRLFYQKNIWNAVRDIYYMFVLSKCTAKWAKNKLICYKVRKRKYIYNAAASFVARTTAATT